MKKKLLLPILGLVSLAATAADPAHIFEIRPWHSDGVQGHVTNYSYSAENPAAGGEKLWFVIRVLDSNWSTAGTTSLTNWSWPKYLDTDMSSESAAWAAAAPKIGIVVSGRTVGATIENIGPDELLNSNSGTTSQYFTDIICSYTLQPGDFALPIRLAADGNGTPIDRTKDSVGAFRPFIINGNLWRWCTASGDAELVWEWADLSSFAYQGYRTPPEGGTRMSDYDLSAAGFFAKTIDFTNRGNEEGLPQWYEYGTAWRGVHEGSSSPEPSTASLTLTGVSTQKTTLYVWSEDDDVIKMGSGTPTTMKKKDGSGEMERVVYTVEFAAGETTKSLPLQAVAAEGASTNIVVSAFKGFRTLDDGTPETDYLTIPVKVIEPEKASVKVTAEAPEKRTVPADHDAVSTPIGSLTLKISGGYQARNNHLEVTVTPSFEDGTEGWSNYVHIATTSDGASWTSADPLVLKFSSDTASGDYDADFAAGNDISVTVYAYALGADTNTATAGHGIFFTPTLDADAETSHYFQTLTKGVMYFAASNPTLSVPAAYDAIGGVERTFELTVDDNYKNYSDDEGYTILYKLKSSASEFKTLQGKWKPNAQGVLVSTTDATKYPSLTYAYSEAPYTTVFKVKTPTGSYESDLASTTVTVSQPAVAKAFASADGGSTFVESATFTEDFAQPDGLEVPVKVQLSETFTDPVWAFLAVTEPSMTNLVSGSVLTNTAGAVGMKIANTGPESAEGYIYLLDGGKGGGNNIQFSVVLCSQETFDASKIVTDYQSGNTLTLKMKNAAAKVNAVTMDGLVSVYTSGDRSTFSAAQDVSKKFTVDVSDVTADLGDDFAMKYTIIESDGTGASGELAGKPAETNFTYTFRSPGEAKVSLWVKDKDASAWSTQADFLFYVTVSDHPSLSVVSEFGDMIDEGIVGIGNAKLALKLSENTSNTPLDFEIKVESAETSATADKGVLRLGGGVTNKLDAQGHTITNVYCGQLRAKQTSYTFCIEDSDGTKASMAKGFIITPSITTTNEVPTAAGTEWKDYFVVDSLNLAVGNVAPTIVCSLGEENTSSNAFAAAIGNADPVTWSVGDIDTDLSKGIDVQWWSTDYGNEAKTNVTDGSEYTFTPRFKSSGVKQVRVTVTDKDKDSGTGTTVMTWYYEVAASKTLTTIASGPSGGITTSKLSQKYAKAKGRGEGHVFASGSFAGAESFTLNWNCGTAAKANVWGFGYKTGAVDNGSLDSATTYARDVPLDSIGYNTTDGKRPLPDCYQYWDTAKDSFFYTWLIHSTENGRTTTSVYGDTAAPELKGQKEARGEVSLPDQKGADGVNYPETTVEGVFAKELRARDNMGDINQDGVPDLYATTRTWDGSSSTLVSVDGNGADLADLRDDNRDGDFLPPASKISQSSLQPGANSDWTSGQKFTTPYEIRGWHEGLNYGMFRANDDERERWVSELDMSPAEIAALNRHVQANGGWNTNEFSNLMTDHDVMTNAMAYIAWTWRSYGGEGEDASTWGFTVENRTDPTTDDTDGDGIPDGYEYYFWYAATVGFGDDGNPIVGRKFNLRDVESPLDITSEEIAQTFNPNVRRDWTWQDTDGDGILDVEEMAIGTNPVQWDTDGDKLSDLYEVMYGIDPLLNNAKGNNGAFNGDGDFMAKADLGAFTIINVRGRMYAISRVADFALDEPGPGTNTLTIVGFPVYAFNGGYMPTVEKFTEGAAGIAYRFVYPVEEDVLATAVEATVSLYHYQVYNYYGFDPRTGWYMDNNGSVSPVRRWFKKGNPRSAGAAVNTAEFSALDEFRLMKYRYLMGLADVEKDLKDIAGAEDPIQKLAEVVRGRTTNPNAALESRTFAGRAYPATVHGADTDEDGVPDGWELYVGVNPNTHFTSVLEGLYGAIRTSDADDGLALVGEFAGTDSCLAYKGCETIYANYPGNADGCMPGWYNKFFPTDPRSDDTDGDGIMDGSEGQDWDSPFVFNRWGQAKYSLVGGSSTVRVNHKAIYGSPDPGISRCVKGGGLNPCTIDTDMDGLPDQWEYKYAGLLFSGDQPAAGVLTATLDPEMYDDIRAAALAYNSGSSTNDASYYVCMGMDPTVFDSNTNEANCDKDWDGDGLENWQEYLVQAMRHFRYDDCVNPLNGYDMPKLADDGSTTAAFCGANGYLKPVLTGGFNAKELEVVRNLGYETFADFVAENPDYLSKLGYFAPAPMSWDPMRDDFKNYLYMQMPQSLVMSRSTRQVQNNTNELGFVIWTGSKLVMEVDPETYRATLVPSTDPADQIVYTNNTVDVDPNYAFEEIGVTNAYLFVRGETEIPAYQLTTTTEPEVHSSSEWVKASSFVSTDPRLWDTDGDGMDDFYEMFHGLNPILGSVGTLSTSETATSVGVITVSSVSGESDVIALAYAGTGINAYQNGYVGWLSKTAPVYDPLRAPWLTGAGSCDADGDGIRNEEEALFANLASPNATHTDPTPLWMTDATVGTKSYPVTGTMAFTNTTVISEVTFPDGTVYVLPENRWIVHTDITEFAMTNSWVTTVKSPSYVAQYYQSTWSGPNQDPTNEEEDGKYGWATSTPYTFEMNEGYDTDADWKADRREQTSIVEPTSDPQDFSDPARRQSLTFGSQGGEGVAISVQPATRETYTANADFLKQFSVEAWVRPETAAAGHPQYVATRALDYGGWDLSNSVSVVRNNFALGITADGRAFAAFDDSADGSVSVEGSTLASGNWTHLAATFDGAELRIFVDGTEVAAKATTLVPANGVTEILQDPQTADGAYFPVVSYRSKPAATVLGGRAASRAAFTAGGIAAAASWGDVAADFFAGSLDEVRVWDGARTPAQIQADFRTRYTADKIKALRLGTYYEYAAGARRNDSTAAQSEDVLSAELVQHYSFCALAGATEPQYVQKVPAGFEANVPAMVDGAVDREAIKVTWWNSVVTNDAICAKQVYSSGWAVPWMQNTVAHLPRLSGNVEDSVFWNENLAGYTPASFQGLPKFSFPNSMNPYNLVQGNGVDSLTSLKFTLLALHGGSEVYEELRERFRYDIRRGFTGTTDLVPVGDVFAKRLDESWDGEGAEDAWAATTDGTADDGDPDDGGIPEWAKAAGYATAEAYARALAQGLLPSGTDSAFASAADLNSNGIPDWWEGLYGVGEFSAHDDPDHDGLSIWQEYLISQGAAYGNGVGADNWPSNLNPRVAITDESKGRVRDYFRAGGADRTAEYVGEIVGDHDFMEDWWERSQGSGYTSAAAYDPWSDADGDGWTAWAECRYSLFTALINASTISHSVGGYEMKDMPVPTLRLTLAYDGEQDVSSAPLVVQTFTSASLTRPDATFTLSAGTTNEQNRLIGQWSERTVRGTLTPGYVTPTSVNLYFMGVDRNEDYTWFLWSENLTSRMLYSGSYAEYIAALNEYRAYGVTWYNAATGKTTRGRVQLLSGSGEWATYRNAGVSVTTDDSSEHGYICVSGERVGTINLVTGEYAIDLSLLGNMTLGGEGTNGTVSISSSLVRLAYTSALPRISSGRLDVSLGDADAGYVKEGRNTIVAFYDLNGDGSYTAGEPFGTVSGVDVGWYMTARTVVELTDTSAVMPRVTLDTVAADRTVAFGSAGRAVATGAAAQDTGLSATYRIVRTSINDIELTGRPTVVSRTLSTASRSYLHEGDVLSSTRLGLDWGTLGFSARRVKLEPEDVTSVGYAVEQVSADTNGAVVATELLRFVNQYNVQRGMAAPVSPVGAAVVNEGRPTLKWKSSDETMTAFRLQMRVKDGDLVYDSGNLRLPGRVGGEYAFSPDVYVGFAATNGAPEFVDGTNYQWRVALLNPKFTEADDNSWNDWSKAEFALSVVPPDGSLTDFGKAAAAVRYYGPAEYQATNVVVEAYDTPDFTGAPLARARLSDKTLVGDRFDLATVNATLLGVEPGEVYLVAFIDRDNNGVRDRYETWGYASQVDVLTPNIYSPNPVLVKSEAVSTTSATIYMEDTDVNRNGVLDCFEDLSALKASASSESSDGIDTDSDGLSDYEETYEFGTDPYKWDTDGDGMPDGWEVLFAGTDPLAADSGDMFEGDVMAWATEPGVVVTFDDDTRLLLREDEKLPQVGDLAKDYRYRRGYEYGEYWGVGIEETAISDTVRVASVKDVTVALVHAQVYGRYGYSPLTANPDVPEADRLNTKAFTALDKYMLVKYFEALGLADETEVNTNRLWASYTLRPGDADCNDDGVADGWELYVMFGPDVKEDVLPASVDEAKVSPWKTAEYVRNAANTPDGGGLSILDEFDRGNASTDPWAVDTDGNGVEDNVAFRFNIKTAASQLGDDDNDGLSNWAEYLAWQLTGMDFDVKNPCSVVDNLPDYFYQVDQNGKMLYVGEALDRDGKGLVADHDFIEDTWEDKFSNMGGDWSRYANRYIWDALRDGDGDGWSNWSEARAATRPDAVATLGIENMTLKEYPVPMIGLTVDYNGSRTITDAPIILKAWRSDSLGGVPDALWVTRQSNAEAEESGDGSSSGSDYYQRDQNVEDTTGLAGVSNTRYLGVWQNRLQKIYLSPGNITPSRIQFKFKDIAYTIQTRQDGYLMETSLGSADNADWLTLVSDIARADDTMWGDLYYTYMDPPENNTLGWRSSVSVNSNGYYQVASAGESHKVKVGTVNYVTGEVSIDFGLISSRHYEVVERWTVNSYYYTRAHIIDPTVSYVKVEYSGAVPEQSFPAHFYLVSAESADGSSAGHVREGVNTFVAFADLDANGVMDEGEPFGYIKNVNVGWDKIPDLFIELTDAPRFADRFTLPAQDGPDLTRVRVMRTRINDLPVKPRAVFSRLFDLTVARTFSEADFVGDDEYDFDWKYLARDAKELAGIELDDLLSVDYEVYVGNGQQPVRTFTRKFNPKNSKLVISGTYEDGGMIVKSARPAMEWTGPDGTVRVDGGCTAFVLQIAEDEDFSKVVYAVTNILPSATENGFVYRPDVYVGEELMDQSTYFWRVAGISAKFPVPELWSDIGSFATRVDSENADTGFGRLAAEVRYFGPAGNDLTNVVVGVYEAADFAGDPVARKRLSGNGTVADLTGDLTRPFTEVAANVVFDGIAPGSYYVMAFIDVNGNGVRDAWESWGYVNKVGLGADDLWSPVAVEVSAEKSKLPDVFLVMEDTDVNQDAVPDCLQDMSGWRRIKTDEDDTSDTDGDGLTDYLENHYYGTDPYKWDTDGDGMPDGWEIENGLDPFMDDGDMAGLQDVMAWKVDVFDIMVSTNGTTNAYYAVRHAYDEETGDRTNLVYNAFFANGVYYVGAPAADRDEAINRYAYAFRTNAVAIHSAVYDLYGFDPTTAVAPGGADTVAFTAYRKYITQALYLAQFRDGDATNDFALSVNKLDSNANYLPDGWELYVRYAAAGEFSQPVARAAYGDNASAALFDPYDDYWFFRVAKESGTLSGDLEMVNPYTNAFAIENGLVGATAAEQEAFWNKALPGDYMAYAEVTAQMVVSNDVPYVAMIVTNELGRVVATNYYETFRLPNATNDVFIVGRRRDLTLTDDFYATLSTNVVLVHSAVYDWFGFDPTTANPRAAERANTRPFSALWKNVTAASYLKGLFGIDWAMNPDAVDSNMNGLPDGWELYVGFAENTVDDVEGLGERFPLDGANLATAVANFGEGVDSSDPWDMYQIYRSLPSTNKVVRFTNLEARAFNIADRDLVKDEDFDGLSNYQEFAAGKTFGMDLDAFDPMSDGATVDYFRRNAADDYLGLRYNAGEFIEPAARSALGMDGLQMAGTRIMPVSQTAYPGWDYWSIARYSYAAYEKELKENSYYNPTLEFLTPTPTVALTLRYGGNGAYYAVVEAYQESEAYPERGEELQWSDILDYPIIDDEGKITSWERHVVRFSGGLVNVDPYYTSVHEGYRGTLKPGKARIVVKLYTMQDEYTGISGEAEAVVGWAGVEADILLGSQNPALPEISLASVSSNGTETVQLLGIVRTKVNGEPVTPRGIVLRKYWNNVARATASPGEYMLYGDDFTGIDPYLETDYADRLGEIESVTYELVRLGCVDVTDLESDTSTISATNLNRYVVEDDNAEGGQREVVQERNEELTINYSFRRDVPLEVRVFADSLVGGSRAAFTVPTDGFCNMRYWVEIDGTVYGGEGGILLDRMTDGVRDVDLDALAGEPLAVGEHTVRVALGNDKYGRPSADDDWSQPAVFKVNSAPSYNGRMKVLVSHALADAVEGTLVLGFYEKPDLASPFKTVEAQFGAVNEVDGLRAEGSYYVAAWLVKDAADGRDTDRWGNPVRMPYDTWGYVTELGLDASSFDAAALTAAVEPDETYALVMQDTDWNDNGVVDRLEEFKDVDGTIEPRIDYGDLNIDGVQESGSLYASEDVMAYAEVDRVLALIGTDEETAVWYTLPKGATVRAGDAAEELSGVKSTYVYAGRKNGPYGEGASVSFTADQGMKVFEVKSAQVALVHAQVYAAFGFSPATANRTIPADQWVNSKLFTLADKTSVAAYLKATGVLPDDADETAWTLDRRNPDTDRDGMPDGWELYVMSGPAGQGVMSISPWDAADRSDDPDGDGLENVDEYDGGDMPTDPWDVDSDDDGIGDKPSSDYLFKFGGEGDGRTGYRGDADNDQLSNFMEYLITGLDGFPELDASAMSTFADAEGQLVPDYFLRKGSLYLGELFADHDMIEDWWEDEQPVETTVGGVRTVNYSRYSYDASRDSDGDGWSNWAEARAEIMGGKVSVTTVETNVVDGVATVVTNIVEKSRYALEGSRPNPTVEAAFRYNGDLSRVGAGDTLVVKAWSAKKSVTGDPDAVWTMPAGELSAGLLSTTLGVPDAGSLREGENTFVAYVVAGEGGASSAFTVGQPYGVVTGVVVNYLKATPFALELTCVDATTMRVNLEQAIEIQKEYSDALAQKDADWWDRVDAKEETQTAEYYAMLDDCFALMADNATDRRTEISSYATLHRPAYCGTNLTFSVSNTVHVWVMQMLINGEKSSDYYKTEFEESFAIGRHPVLTEADVLGAGLLDLGWNTLRESKSNWAEIESAVFGVVIAPTPASYYLPNNLLLVEVENHYEATGSQTPVTYVDATMTGSQPTFRWSHDNTIGKPYPAFRLRVWKKDGTTLVYDSGDLRAPARDANGVYSWTAPIFVDSPTPQGVVFESEADYVWGVSMLDAKFRDPLRKASLEGRGGLHVSDPAGAGGLSDYGSIAVAVKYMGPGAVNVSGTRGIVRVEAYESLDFSGSPAAAGYVRNKDTIAAIDKIALNALLKGLPKRREYYVLAYIDSNGSGTREAWESWGYGCYVGDPERRDVYTPRAYGVATTAADDLKTPTCVIYLEDCDTNGNSLPDVLETDSSGEFSPVAAPTAPAPYIVTVDGSGNAGATNMFAAIRKDVVALPYYSTLVEMENGGTLASASLALAMAGVDVDTLSVDPKVTITSFSPTEGIEIEVDPCATVDGETLVATPARKSGGGYINVTLRFTFEWTPNLATAWTEFAETTKSISLSETKTLEFDDAALRDTINKKIREISAENPTAFFRLKSVEVVR